MARALAAVFVVAMVSLVCTAEALPRIQAFSALKDAFSKPVELIDADELVVPEPTEYKNPKPLIGILSQACHYCPGK